MANYADDSDLAEVRANILDLVPVAGGDWESKHDAATLVINHDLEVRWFNAVLSEEGLSSRNYTFDPDKILSPERLKNLAVYKTLELIYEYLTKDVIDDPFAKERDYYAKKYRDEFERVLVMGLDYDWNSNSLLDASEIKEAPLPRTLERM